MWRSRTRLWGALLVGVLAVLAAGSGRAGEPARSRLVETTDDLFIVRAKGPFQDVVGLLEDAIRQRNYFIGGYTDVGEGIRKRAQLTGKPVAFDAYKIVSFCNLSLADEALRAHPHVGAFMPCRAAVYAPAGSDEVFIVAMRPIHLARVFPSPGIEQLARRVEADVLAILEFVAGF